jgi:hypothetical protein
MFDRSIAATVPFSKIPKQRRRNEHKLHQTQEFPYWMWLGDQRPRIIIFWFTTKLYNLLQERNSPMMEEGPISMKKTTTV